MCLPLCLLVELTLKVCISTLHNCIKILFFICIGCETAKGGDKNVSSSSARDVTSKLKESLELG